MVRYFQRMKLVSSSWLRPRTILDQPTTVTLGTLRVNCIGIKCPLEYLQVWATTLVSLLFIHMIPIACKITALHL